MQKNLNLPLIKFIFFKRFFFSKWRPLLLTSLFDNTNVFRLLSGNEKLTLYNNMMSPLIKKTNFFYYFNKKISILYMYVSFLYKCSYNEQMALLMLLCLYQWNT